jgi:hypothetical protein
MEDDAKRTLLQTQELHKDVKAFVEEIKIKIFDFETIMSSRVTKDVVTLMGKEIEGRLR